MRNDMAFRTLLQVGVVAALFSVSLAAPAHAQSQQPQGAHVVVLGSSTAEGAGPEQADSAWVARYRVHLKAQNPAHRVTNLARGGYMTHQILPSGHAVPDGRPQPDTARNITQALALKPSALVINLPSNDAANGVPASEQMANLQVVTERAEAAGVPVWIATPQPRNFEPEKRQIQRDLLAATEARYGPRAVDFWRGLAAEDGTLRPEYDAGDGTHLNSRGHALLFERIAAANVTAPSATASGTTASDTTASDTASMARRDVLIDSLLAAMTVEEKLGQLAQYTGRWATTGPSADADQEALIRAGEVGSFLNIYTAEETRRLQEMAVEESRLGIPLLFAYDVVHGFRTIFPIPLAQAASFDTAAVERAARVAAVEATAAGIHWTFAPMVDVTQDPRWGRIMEGAGEDPYLGAVMARAGVRGFQGDDLTDESTVLATAKHFVAYGGAKAGRDYNTVDVSERTLRELYLPPFRAAVDAGVATIMAAFNEVGGVPMHANERLIEDVLRGEWGWDGLIVADYTGVMELMQHGIAATETEAGIKALRAGVDVDMVSGIYGQELPDAVRAGRLPEEEVDEAVRRVLQAKYNLGLFEDPYRYSDPEREEAQTLTESHREVALDLAQKSIVLLKNEDLDGSGQAVLPFSEDLGTLAVIGPLAEDARSALGEWAGAGRAEDAVSVLEGIRQAAVEAQMEVRYARGLDTLGTEADTAGIAEAVALSEEADAVVLVLGEDYNMSGEAASRTSLDLPNAQQQLAEAVHATGTPVAVVLMAGRPLAISWLDENAPAIVMAWYLGTEMGPAVADVLFGDYNPGGKLPVTFPRNVGQVPIYYNHKNTGRPPVEGQDYTSTYLDTPTTPLYPFGHGLSYTTFAYDSLQLGSQEMRPTDSLRVEVRVANTGERAGAEVMQLYLRDLTASVTRPVKELRGFRRVMLDPGEAETVAFTLTAEDLAFYDLDMTRAVEPGRFKVFVGGSSEDVMEAEFEVTGEKYVVDAAGEGL